MILKLFLKLRVPFNSILGGVLELIPLEQTGLWVMAAERVMLGVGVSVSRSQLQPRAWPIGHGL